VLGLAACAADDVGSDEGSMEGDPGAVGSTSEAMTANEILARADAFIAAKVPYCGAVRGGKDYMCGGTCQRPAAAWDHYRSDCSGFVSWCWQIASVPSTHSYIVDKSGANGWHTVAIDELRAGDAVVCDGHIKLFSKFVGKGSAEIYEEYNCGHVGRKGVQTFTRSGNTLKFAYDSRIYHGIRRNGLTAPAPPAPPPAAPAPTVPAPTVPAPTVPAPTGSLPTASVVVKGAIDIAARSVAGWAVDMDAKDAALTIDAYFDGDATKGFHVQARANLPRVDVAKALGVLPEHGFSIATPLFYCDGSAHTVTVLGAPADGKSPRALLGTAARSVSCAVPPAKAGILRHVVDPTSLAAWKLDVRRSLRWTSPADRAAYEVAAALPPERRVGRTSDGAVWLVDGDSRRAAGNADALVAWSVDAASVSELTAAEVALPEGVALPSRPVLVQALGAPEIYLLDVDPANEVDPGAEGPDEVDPVSSSLPRRHELSGPASDGCSVGVAGGAGSPSGGLALALLGLVLGAARARRRGADAAQRGF
jgi:MYXO-CTERM domain-containing protein